MVLRTGATRHLPVFKLLKNSWLTKSRFQLLYNVVNICLLYLKRGWSVVPVPHRQKFPDMDWKMYQRKRASESEARGWFSGGKEGKAGEEGEGGSVASLLSSPGTHGLAVICGMVSGNLVCLDFDDLEAYEAWAEANPVAAKELPTAKSARGRHVFFRTVTPIRSGKFCLGGLVTGNSELVNGGAKSDPVTNYKLPIATPAGDLISEGKLVVLPPTIHPTGFQREWMIEPGDVVPTRTLEELGVERWKSPSTSGGGVGEGDALGQLGSDTPLTLPSPGMERVQTGNRHEHLMRQSLLLHRAGVRNDSLAQCLFALNQTQCQPPLPRFEVAQLATWTNALPEEKMLIEREIQTPLGRSSVVAILPDPEAERARYDAAFVAAPEYLEEQDAEVEWLVEGFLPTGYLVILGGTSKAGKSCFLTALAVAIAEGKEFLGCPVFGSSVGGEGQPKTEEPSNPKPPSVLWCCFEESKAERAMMIRMHGQPSERLLVTHDRPMIDTPDGLALLRHNVRKHNAKLLVIDPLYGANSAESLSDGRSARGVLEGLKELCNEEGCTAIVIHHLTKNVGAGLTRERMADSNQILAAASMDILMDSKDEKGGGRLITLKCRGRGTFANQNWIVRSGSVTEFELVSHGEGVTAGDVSADSPRQVILRKLAEGPRDAESLSSDAGVSYAYARKMLADLMKEGLVELGEKLLTRKQYQLTQAGHFHMQSATASP